MKQITLNFREVAVDGLPDRSMDVLVVSRSEEGFLYGMMEVAYSSKHEQFNNYDSQEKNAPSCFADVAYWIPSSELEAILAGGETP